MRVNTDLAKRIIDRLPEEVNIKRGPLDVFYYWATGVLSVWLWKLLIQVDCGNSALKTKPCIDVSWNPE